MRANKDLFLAITQVSAKDQICGVKLDLTGITFSEIVQITGITFSEIVQTPGGRVA